MQHAKYKLQTTRLMQYDPIKRMLGKVFNQSPWLRILFYKMLDLLLLRSWHVRRELKILKTSRPHKLNILDAGSGFGQYTWFMQSLFRKAAILAVDVKAEQVADCNAFFTRMGKNKVRFEVADLTLFTWNDHFDLILSVDVMEHIEEDVKVFRNFYDSLTQEGILLISTPSDQGGSDVHDHDHGESFIDEHVRDGYGMDEIREKLRMAGFSRTEARYTYGKPGQLGWRLSMKYPIMLLSISKIFFLLLPFYYLVTFPLALVCNFLDLRWKHTSGTGLLVKAIK